MNEKFLACLKELRGFAGGQTSELQCPLLRLLQVEAYLEKHVARATASKSMKIDAQMLSAASKPQQLEACHLQP
ncbi:MAG: hypothetical protein V4627_03350 [Pseudomonadota bacterium]